MVEGAGRPPAGGGGGGHPPPGPAAVGPPPGTAPRPVLMADPDPLTRRDLTRTHQAARRRAVRNLDWNMSNKMAR